MILDDLYLTCTFLTHIRQKKYIKRRQIVGVLKRKFLIRTRAFGGRSIERNVIFVMGVAVQCEKTAYITNKQGTAAENDEIGLWTRLSDMRGVKVYCKKKKTM